MSRVRARLRASLIIPRTVDLIRDGVYWLVFPPHPYPPSPLADGIMGLAGVFWFGL